MWLAFKMQGFLGLVIPERVIPLRREGFGLAPCSDDSLMLRKWPDDGELCQTYEECLAKCYAANVNNPFAKYAEEWKPMSIKCPECGAEDTIVRKVGPRTFNCKTGRVDGDIPHGISFTVTVADYEYHECNRCLKSFSPAGSVRRMEEARREAVIQLDMG